MIRSASGYGRGRNNTELTMLKIAVLAPIPRASVRIATAANAGFLVNWRRAKRKLFITKRHHGIDAGRATRGNEARRCGNRGQQRCDRKINGRVERIDLEQNILERRGGDDAEKQCDPARA